MAKKLTQLKKRPFESVDLEEVYGLALLGLKDREIAENHLHVPYEVFGNWVLEEKSLREILYMGREGADQKVAVALYQRCCGYSHPEIDIKVVNGEVVQTEIMKHYPPDTSAIKFWLINRHGGRWNDMRRVENSGPDGIAMQLNVDSRVVLSPVELANRLRLFIQDQALRELTAPEHDEDGIDDGNWDVS